MCKWQCDTGVLCMLCTAEIMMLVYCMSLFTPKTEVSCFHVMRCVQEKVFTKRQSENVFLSALHFYLLKWLF